MCRTRAGVGLKVERRVAIGSRMTRDGAVRRPVPHYVRWRGKHEASLQVCAQDFLRLDRSRVENADLIPPDLVISTEFHRIQFGAVALHVFTSANYTDETLLEENQREGQEVPPTASTTQLLWKTCRYRCWASRSPTRARWHPHQ